MRILLAFLIFFSFNAISATPPNCSVNGAFNGKLFELSVVTSFNGNYNFEFCYDKTSYLISEYSEVISVKRPLRTTVKHDSKAELDSNTALIIKDLYRAVQATIKTDDSRGMDGSTWCFKPKNGSTYSETCLWSPYSNTERRNLTDLVTLGNKLFEISNFESVQQ
ncbi:hypothetical protein [Pseudoalteromonas sp. S2755]|uniref:hypothetical protein n=1 Tax=Pseudoalteromonas sp. S2755 TaxID=2066523 RepID=UPI00110AC989|nr:hypothetical protein [Pseudoalteromonas sp. S2755]